MSPTPSDSQATPKPQHAVSVILWGGDKPDEDPPAHIGIGVHAAVPQPETCYLHRVRNPGEFLISYCPRPAHAYVSFDTQPAPRGRCELVSHLADPDAANALLEAYGEDQRNLPRLGQGDSHDWTAGAVAALEKAGLARPGDGALWKGLVGKGPRAMERAWREAGGVWVPCEAFGKNRPEVVDARWGDDDELKGMEGGMDAFRGRVSRIEELLAGGDQ
ncbi:hypothetical protein F4780DRAFT_82023 [Xylariomycetidae sp. FL0641]|nr:hypothetical protein F4780DRAFT_82023 [Xylariomycetidae sp. FL0641]